MVRVAQRVARQHVQSRLSRAPPDRGVCAAEHRGAEVLGCGAWRWLCRNDIRHLHQPVQRFAGHSLTALGQILRSVGDFGHIRLAVNLREMRRTRYPPPLREVIVAASRQGSAARRSDTVEQPRPRSDHRSRFASRILRIGNGKPRHFL